MVPEAEGSKPFTHPSGLPVFFMVGNRVNTINLRGLPMIPKK